jgi:hypothetical protein
LSAAGFDFLAHCRPGLELRTRDRRRAVIARIDVGERQIHGAVEMIGSCAWHADGRYVDAPCRAAGPLDLTRPASDRPGSPRRASLAEMLDPANRSACCD